MVTAMLGVQLKDTKGDLMMLSLSKAKDQLAQANSVHCHGHVLREDGQI